MRRVIVILLAGLALLGGAAYAARALRVEGAQAGFTIAVAPERQVATPGERVAYSVTVRRRGGFDGPVRLRVRGLPAGTRAIWRLNDGTLSALVPRGGNGAVLVLDTSRATPIGRKRPRIRASGGGHTRRTSLAVRIERPRRRMFTLGAKPRRRVVAPGETTTYGIRVKRVRGFRRTVRLRVARLPAGTRVAWSPASARTARRRARLRIRVANGAEPASARLIVTGRSRAGGRRVRRSRVLVLEVARPLPFRIGGDLGMRLYPGASFPLDLALVNPHDFAIRVTDLTVGVRSTTTSPGCSGSHNFGVTQYTGPYPLTLPPGSSSLSALVPDRALWPRVAMLDLPVNQDACKNTGLTLDYGGKAVR